MATITVSNWQGFAAAMKAATSGDTILLQPGVYAPFTLRGVHTGGNVTVTSADPNQPATLNGLTLNNVSGFTFTNLEVAVTAASNKDGAIGIFSSRDIHFDKLNVHGSLNGNPADDTDGFRIKTSTNVSVTNSEFQELRIAIGHGDSQKLNFTGNHIHDIRMDGIRGGGSSDVVIANNYFTDFYQNAGDHADAIQFYTGNIIKVVENITISGNVIVQGDGQEIQGIFMRNEEAAGLFKNVNVSDNLVIGGNWNGIAVSNADRLSVTNNTIISMPGETSWLRVEGVKNADVSGNSAVKFLIQDGVAQSGNRPNITVSDDGAAALRDWLGRHPDASEVFQGEGMSQMNAKAASAAKLTDLTVSSSSSFTLDAAARNLTLTGSNHIEGAGNTWGNSMVGNEGNNRLLAYEGDDTLNGGNGNDVLDGGEGVDTASYEGSDAPVVVSLIRWNGNSASGAKQDTRGAGQDTLISIENLTGSAHSDTLTGDNNDNVLRGGAGNDRLIGRGGADTLVGGEGADIFLYTATADSTVDASGRDSIVDFDPFQGDKIMLTQIDAVSSTTKNDAFTFVSKLSGKAGQLTVTYEVDHYVVSGDVNGDAVADFALNVFSTRSLFASDFLL